MSDQIKHECGIAMVRLLKPLEYYQEKYGTWRYGFHKLHLLMEKQHNRGQDGAGLATLKLNATPGQTYFHRERSNGSQPIKDIFGNINRKFAELQTKNKEAFNDAAWAKENVPFAGEVMVGHLRYGTFGKNDIGNVHPVMRENNWRSRNLVMAGNFNLTNVDELFENLIKIGQHPKAFSDTVTILENVGHFLDEENQGLFEMFKRRGHSNKEISALIAKNIDVANILRESSKKWDGGYAILGMMGHGDAFIYRDPSGIRPAYYYHDDEIVVAASERAVIQTAMNITEHEVNKVQPGNALIVKLDGRVFEENIREPKEKTCCSFERIYFSRGGDHKIYKERKRLGYLLKDQILESVDGDLENSVFSFIPNTAESAFYGMVDSVRDHMTDIRAKRILEIPKDELTEERLKEILTVKVRVEKVAVKDIKMRTFIAEDEGRNDLVGHVYDVTYGTINRGVDNLVVIDDSIVRGTTLKQSIIRILDRLEPKKIIIVSSSPQIRYPDCYGIDMANIGDFIAFRAAIALLKESGQVSVIEDVYKKSKAQEALPKEEITNYVREIYEPFTEEEISKKIAELVTSPDVKSKVEIVYQTVANLHAACPEDLGDWYFTGNYPTPGGNKVVNQAFINYYEGRKGRAY